MRVAHQPVACGTSAGGEALLDAVRRELREDASTTALDLSVKVHDGVVILLGSSVGPEDAEAAEAVAARVPGIQEIVKMLKSRRLSRVSDGRRDEHQFPQSHRTARRHGLGRTRHGVSQRQLSGLWAVS
jgi:hypothetical protein